MTPAQRVSAFIARINAHDVDGVCALMEESHVFIDGLGRSVTGREAMRHAWRTYFAMVPDYRIQVDRLLQEGTVVAVFGRAGGTVIQDGRLEPRNRWEIPAAWQAVVGDGGIAVWQVFADNEPLRKLMAPMVPGASPPRG